MCIACEQGPVWFAYLRRRGLITADGRLVEQAPSPAGPVEPAVAGEKAAEQVQIAKAKEEKHAVEPADQQASLTAAG
jgi:hypothetical protein